MARRLQPDEEWLFSEALSTCASETAVGEVDAEWFRQKVIARRDKALALSPEVQALLQSKFPQRYPQ